MLVMSVGMVEASRGISDSCREGMQLKASGGSGVSCKHHNPCSQLLYSLVQCNIVPMQAGIL